MPQQSKDVTIGEHKYQILEFPARIGSRVTLQMGPRLSQMGREEYEEFENLCWGQCRRYHDGLPVPLFILKRDKEGKEQLIWQFPDLEYDTFTTTKLIKEVLALTTAPFSAEQESEEREARHRSSSPSI